MVWVTLSEVLLPESVAAVSQGVRVRVRQVLQAVDGSVVGAGAEDLAGVLVEGSLPLHASGSGRIEC